MNSAKETKKSQLVAGSLINVLKELTVVTSQLHPDYNDPKHDIDNCNICEAISAAKAMLTIHKA